MWYCIRLKKREKNRNHYCTVCLNTVYVDLAVIRKEIREQLMPPTLQSVNANQNDKHVMVQGQLYYTCQASSSLRSPGLVQKKKSLQ